MEKEMEPDVVVKVGDCIVSPLGDTTRKNYEAVRKGDSRLCYYEHPWNLPESLYASLFSQEQWQEVDERLSLSIPYTRFEKIVILSAKQALEEAGIDPSSERVLFLLSTTKGNVELLAEREQPRFPAARVLLGETALQVSRYFRNPNTPLVLSNACISGVSVQVAAMRLLLSGAYDSIVVMGADCQSPFIVSGFQSFKALSTELCRPFDKDRCGLNLGEAAATVVLTRKARLEVAAEDWVLRQGGICNDANHISGPSRTGEGSYRALLKALQGISSEELAFVNVHGTATAYNDEMESIALDRAGLSSVPVNGLKGYFGHTMGAAGILESLLSMEAVDDHCVLATRGFESLGVSRPVRVSNRVGVTNQRAFIKLMSGFGGCNAALLYQKGGTL
jgi:3-oxoacyl-[acyl-carrier-protein] synthase-1